MKLPNINLSKLTATVASAGAIAGTVVNAAGAGQVHVPPAVLSALIALAWLGQSPLVHPTESNEADAATGQSKARL